ncbi:MAG: methyltransferase [Planctomycetota bacterium]|jgi:hypothetical protein
MLIRPDDTSFTTFFELLTAYRASELLRVSSESRLFDTIGEAGAELEHVLESTGWKAPYGERVLTALVHLGLLGRHEDTYYLSQFSRRFLWSGSADSQRQSLSFEARLVERWGTLAEQLESGERGARDKNEDEYRKSLALFLEAMDEAARFRSRELWDTFEPARQGTILEVGAGSGAYLADFLERHPHWNAIFCDLEDVVKEARSRPRLERLSDRFTYVAANLFESAEPLQPQCADILLCSNFIHCQGMEETQAILGKAIPCLRDEGVLILHDFFTGENPHAPLQGAWALPYPVDPSPQPLFRPLCCPFPTGPSPARPHRHPQGQGPGARILRYH